MIIRGILDRSLSNQICIRGFARIKELARISKANEAYQRKLVDAQEKVVSNFLTEENEMLFFPEVILSLKLKYDYTIKNAKQDSPIQQLENNHSFISNVDAIHIKSYKEEFKIFDINERNDIFNVEIEINDEALNKSIALKEHPFHRIDGNHRLSAAEQIEGDRIDRMNIPFCIVLFEETTSSKFNPEKKEIVKVTDKRYEKFEKVVFNNINYKTLPLTDEQNLRVILDDCINFPDNDIANIFGESWLLARKLYNKIDLNYFIGIKHILIENIRTYARNIFELLLLKGYSKDKIIDDVFEALKVIEQLYLQNNQLAQNNSEGIFSAFIYYCITDKIRYSFFKEWVLNNDIFEIREAKAETIIQIFDKVVDQSVKLFVAMPFFSEEEVETYNQAYQRVVQKISEEHPQVQIKLYPIMQHHGETYNINNKMIEQINACNILIADISGNNINVAYELGYARSKEEKSVIIIKKEQDPNKTPFDYEQDMCHTYKANAIHTLETMIKKEIETILKKRYLIV